MDIIPDKRKITGLVESAYDGRIALPNFQRDFVWRRDEVADLVRSILRGYFIGSLLLLRCDKGKPPFAPVGLRGSKPSVTELSPEHLILDGQQRISSLIYALTAPDLSLKDSSKRRWYFVDLDLLVNDPENDEIVFDRTQRELRGLDDVEVQYEQHVLPCTALLSQDRFYAWRDGFEDWLDENRPDDVSVYKSEWRGHWTRAVTDFQGFEAPLVELPVVDESDPESIGRVCAIFEKLNSTGVELSVYDLLTARLYRSEVRLHDLWSAAIEENERLRRWSKGDADHHKFGVLVLRTVALLRGLDPKPRILIDLDPLRFEEDWKKATLAIERALELLEHVGEDGFGVFDEKWLPGFGLIPILAALRFELEDRKLGEAERADLRRWYWCNVFLERYSSAVESKSRKDYLEMLAMWTGGSETPEVFRLAEQVIGSPTFSIADSQSSGSSRYSGVFCLLAIRNARDWRRGEAIELQNLQDHHVFPKAYLNRHEIKARVRVNSIANRTLISDETNNKIKDAAPAAYLASSEIFPAGATAEIVEPHFIDDRSMASMSSASEELEAEAAGLVYREFVAAREASMLSEIRSKCGFANVEADESVDKDEWFAGLAEDELTAIAG